MRIQINGAILSVHANVHELLLHLRDSRARFPRQPHFYWIEGVCANQDDAKERMHQTRLMQGVYSTAEVVMVWLGAGNKRSDDAMEYLGGLERDECGGTVRGGGGEMGISARRGSGKDATHFGNKEVEATFQGEIREKVVELLGNEYWGHMHIAHEVLLARKLVLLCGAERISWKRLENLFFSRWGSFGAFTTLAHRLIMARACFQAESLTTKGASATKLWEGLRTSQWTDVREIVYALLALLMDGSESGPRLDGSSLANLGRHFDRIMELISHELNSLTEECSMVDLVACDSMGHVLDNADAEIARLQGIMRRIDYLELYLDRIAQIRYILHGFKIQVEEIEARLDMGHV